MLLLSKQGREPVADGGWRCKHEDTGRMAVFVRDFSGCLALVVAQHKVCTCVQKHLEHAHVAPFGRTVDGRVAL